MDKPSYDPLHLWTVAYVFSDHVGGLRATDPHIVPVDLPRYVKASFVWEHDLFQVIFVILYATDHFQSKHLAFWVHHYLRILRKVMF